MKKRVTELAVAVLAAWTTDAASGPPPWETVDISGDVSRHAIVASGANGYQGHPTTAMLADQKTIFCTWPTSHGGWGGNLAVSRDGGLTWTRADERLPPGMKLNVECPLIHRLVGPDGVSRLWIWSGFKARTRQEAMAGCGTKQRYAAARVGAPMPSVLSEDDGRTWREMPPLGAAFRCVLSFQGIVRLRDGGYLGVYHRGPEACVDAGRLEVLASVTRDGGFTWSEPQVIASDPRWDLCEPWVFRSPDGSELACLMRENRRTGPSKVIFSRDEGRTWTRPRDVPPGLTGDRHQGVMLPDGRLAVCFRDVDRSSPTRNHFVAWIGSYEALKGGDRSQAYHVKLLYSHAGWDCGYPGVQLLADGTVVCTTYITYRPGDGGPSVVTTRFRADETDALFYARRPWAWGRIDRCGPFVGLHPRFEKAFAFLRRPDLASLPVGRYEIEGDDCWAMVQEVELTPFGDVQRAEVHRAFIDIQSPLDGPETYGLFDAGGEAFRPFDADGDIGFAARRTRPLTLFPGEFAVFFPVAGAHAPCKTTGARAVKRRKLVIKVRK